MQPPIRVLTAILVFSCAVTAKAKQTFENLDFEQANPGASEVPRFLTAASGLPGWTLYLGSTQSGQVLYNSETVGTASIDLVSSQYPDVEVIDGQYSTILQSGTDSPEGGPGVGASIAQNGTIPTNAQSLQFKAASSDSQLLSVSFGGSSLSSVALGSGVGPSGLAYTLYGIDIAPYEGQSGQLEFTENLGGNTELDDITFSTLAVPEPNTLELILLGGTMLGLRGWKKLK
jgi:hypothetical protein